MDEEEQARRYPQALVEFGKKTRTEFALKSELLWIRKSWRDGKESRWWTMDRGQRTEDMDVAPAKERRRLVRTPWGILTIDEKYMIASWLPG